MRPFFSNHSRVSENFRDLAARKRGGKAARPGLSAEQIPVLIARDRNGEVFDAILEKVDAKQLGAVLKPVLSKDALLCADGRLAFKAMPRKLVSLTRP